MTIRIKAAELHQRVGDVLAQIRYNGERVIIERRGKPVAAVISIGDLEQLQNGIANLGPKRSLAEQLASLERAAAVRRLILAERKARRLPNSSEAIREIREERTKRVAGHR